MAYDPKAYLQQALKTGFKPTYQPTGASVESGQEPLAYAGDSATFGNVSVRPLYGIVGETEQSTGTSQPTGEYAVSVPLGGEYKGWFRNDTYDKEGNFLGTGYTPPDDDKYGLKGLAQLGLMAASFGGLGPIAQGLASTYKGVQAAKSGDWLSAAASILPNVGFVPGVDKGLADTLKTAGGYAKTASALEKAINAKDPLAILSALPGTPGVPQIPSDIADILSGVGQAKRVREAVRNEDPYALFREIVGSSKAGAGPKKLVDTAGENITEGFFDVGGEGYMEPEAGALPDWALDPYRPDIDVNAPATADDWYQEGAIPTYSGVPEWDDALDIALQTGKVPGTADQTVTMTGSVDNTDIDPWLQPFLTGQDDTQIINVTGTKATGFTEEPDRTVGSPTDTTPQPPKPDDDRTVAPTPVSAPTPAPGPAPTPAPAPGPTPAPAAKPGMDLSALFALLGAMGGQQPSQAPAPYQTARIDTESPFGLMYGMRG